MCEILNLDDKIRVTDNLHSGACVAGYERMLSKGRLQNMAVECSVELSLVEE